VNPVPTTAVAERANAAERPVAGASAARANSPGVRIALLAFVVSPLAVVAILCVLIAMSLKAGPKMAEPPRGAGAGTTGMYNQHMGGGRGD
jgi:hypothetical protein